MNLKTYRYEKQHNYADKNIRSRLLEEIREHPCRFASEHEYGCLNIIGKAKERKDLHCLVRLSDLAFFSEAKVIIRKLCGVCDDAELRAQKAEDTLTKSDADKAVLVDALDECLEMLTDMQRPHSDNGTMACARTALARVKGDV